MPDTKTVAVVNGNSPNEKFWLEQISKTRGASQIALHSRGTMNFRLKNTETGGSASTAVRNLLDTSHGVSGRPVHHENVWPDGLSLPYQADAPKAKLPSSALG